jgi:hypothetical protein
MAKMAASKKLVIGACLVLLVATATTAVWPVSAAARCRECAREAPPTRRERAARDAKLPGDVMTRLRVRPASTPAC